MRLQADVPVHLPAVTTNAEAMRIMVRNLLDNAMQYTPAGGLITVDAMPEGPRSPNANNAPALADQTSEVIIHVTDTDAGIPPMQCQGAPFIPIPMHPSCLANGSILDR